VCERERDRERERERERKEDTSSQCKRRAMRCCKSAKTRTGGWVRERKRGREEERERERELYETCDEMLQDVQ
jgi:hypothetical protein